MKIGLESCRIPSSTIDLSRGLGKSDKSELSMGRDQNAERAPDRQPQTEQLGMRT